MTGLAACATCGGGHVTRTRGGTGRARWHTYVCGSWYYRGGRVCSNRLEALNAKTDRALLSAVEQALFKGDVAELTIQEALSLWQPAHDARDQQREVLRAELRRLEGEIARLTDAVASGGDLASLVTALREREARIREMRARLRSPVGRVSVN